MNAKIINETLTMMTSSMLLLLFFIPVKKFIHNLKS